MSLMCCAVSSSGSMDMSHVCASVFRVFKGFSCVLWSFCLFCVLCMGRAAWNKVVNDDDDDDKFVDQAVEFLSLRPCCMLHGLLFTGASQVRAVFSQWLVNAYSIVSALARNNYRSLMLHKPVYIARNQCQSPRSAICTCTFIQVYMPVTTERVCKIHWFLAPINWIKALSIMLPIKFYINERVTF